MISAMRLENLIYKIRSNIKLRYIKHAWLNLKKDKAKAIFGIAGIMTSIILLTAIGMVNDTLSYNYMEIVTSTTGNSDILISKRIQSDLNYNPFFNESIIETTLNDIEGVEELFPRMMMLVRAYSDKVSSNYTLQLYGIDFIKEANNGHIGDLILVNSEGEETGQIYSEKPSIGECVLLWNTAQLLNVSLGDYITVDYLGDSVDLEVIAICRQELKFTDLENTLIIVNIEQAQSILTRGRKEINFIAGTVENPESIYDVRDVDLTLRKLRIIAFAAALLTNGFSSETKQFSIILKTFSVFRSIFSNASMHFFRVFTSLLPSIKEINNSPASNLLNFPSITSRYICFGVKGSLILTFLKIL